MAEPPPPPPPRDPRDPDDPRDPAEDETIIADGWGPEDPVFVERQPGVVDEEVVEEEPRRMPTIWPWLLALLLLVLAGLAAAYFLTRDEYATHPQMAQRLGIAAGDVDLGALVVDGHRAPDHRVEPVDGAQQR